MNVSKFVRLQSILTTFIFSIFSASAHAEAATFHIKSGDANVPLKITYYSVNSCYQGPTVTTGGQSVTWDAPRNGVATMNVGQNGAVAGCVGELCVEFSPAKEGKQYQCFAIHGGGGVAPIKGRIPAIHPGQKYNDGVWNATTYTYHTAKLPPTIAKIAAADTIYAKGRWKRICSPTAKCSISAVNRITISHTLANSMTDELETAIATTISNTFSVGVESSTPISKADARNDTTLSVTASVNRAVSNTKSRSQGKATGAEETLTCEYNLPIGRFGYIFETTVRIGGQEMVHRTCDFACGDENPPLFPNGSKAHLNSCTS